MKKALILAAAAAMIVGCSTNPYTGERRASRAATSGAGGAAAGAAAGAIIGAATGGGAGKGAAIGAAAGAAIGVGIGVYQDRQQAKLRERLLNSGVQIQRDPNNDNLYLIMPSDVTFAVNQSDINPGFYETLNSVALVFAEYNKTTITVEGHADATGSDSYNMQLSQRRAMSVLNYLSAQGVAAGRMQAIGYGESAPIADNATESGRALNRRVRIVIDPIESEFNS